MKQQNSSIQSHCDTKVLQVILNCPAFYKLPLFYSDTWESIPTDSNEIYERIKLLENTLTCNLRDKMREPHHFLTMLLVTQVHESTIPYYKDTTNENIQRACRGGRTTETTIRLAEIKTALVCKYLRFMKNALDAFYRIAQDYDNLPRKTHITQKVVNDELNTKLALHQMLQNLSGDVFEELSIQDSQAIPYPALDAAKKLGIPLKEFKQIYPLYRSKFNHDTRFTYCIWRYAYSFFANNFTYETKEDAAIFAYGSMEYIKHIVYDTIYNPPIDSTYNSILDAIKEQKQKPAYNYLDIVICNININTTSEPDTIGIYFPQNNTNFIEYIN